MNMLKKMMVLLAALCLVMSLAACGGDAQKETSTAAETQEETKEIETTTQAPETETQDDGKVEYTVKIVDEDGKAVAGAMVQMCKDTCYPAKADAEGVAKFNIPGADGYKVTFLSLPAGYTYSTEAQEFYFDGEATELTIVLKAE